MAANQETPVIQILDKSTYASHLVPLPSATTTTTPLTAPSSIRLRTEVLALTSNTFTYVRLGEIAGYFNYHPIPTSLVPAPYNDTSKYARTNCWGYGRVVESTFPGCPQGTLLFGYYPLGTLPEDHTVEAGPGGQIIVTDEGRRGLMPVYQRYQPVPQDQREEVEKAIASRGDGPALDALVKVMHLTAYLMRGFGFNADPARMVNPCSGPEEATPWSGKHAELEGATVVCFAPGSKVSLSFVDLLRHEDIGGKGKPAKIIGVASPYSKAFVEGTGLYDQVLSTEEADPVAAVGFGGQGKLVIFEFGSRGNAAIKWGMALRASPPFAATEGNVVGVDRFQYVGVGVEMSTQKLELAQMAGLRDVFARLNGTQINADDMKTRAVGKVGGEASWLEGCEESWQRQKERNQMVKGMKVTWGEGMDAVHEGYEKMGKGEVGPDVGLVFKL